MKNITKESIETVNNLVQSFKKGGKSKKNWIQSAVNPKHKGYCTPMTKATCTPKRKALAKTFKNMAKHKEGGSIEFLQPLINQFKLGGIISQYNK